MTHFAHYLEFILESNFRFFMLQYHRFSSGTLTYTVFPYNWRFTADNSWHLRRIIHHLRDLKHAESVTYGVYLQYWNIVGGVSRD